MALLGFWVSFLPNMRLLLAFSQVYTVVVSLVGTVQIPLALSCQCFLILFGSAVIFLEVVSQVVGWLNGQYGFVGDDRQMCMHNGTIKLAVNYYYLQK